MILKTLFFILSASQAAFASGPSALQAALGFTAACNDLSVRAPANMLGYWKLDNNYTDTLGNYNGSTPTTAAFTTSSRMGTHAVSISSGEMNMGDIAALNVASQVTMTAWIRRTGTVAGYQTICGKGISSNSRIGLQFAGPGTGDWTGLFAMVDGGAPGFYTATGAMPLNVWKHVVFVFDGTQGTGSDRIKIYLDGVRASLTAPYTPPSSTNNMAGSGFHCDGDGNFQMDELALFSRALTDLEIRNVYDQQSCGKN